MPVCKKCLVSFPNRLLIDGKYRVVGNRVYCLICKPFGQKGRFKNPVKSSDMPIEDRKFVCEICSKEYFYFKYSGHTKKVCNSCLSNRYRKERKRVALEYLGGRCVVCGYSRCARALHFHHLDPSLKDFSISGKHCYSWDKIKVELDKCVILCSVCHAEVEDGIISLNSNI